MVRPKGICPISEMTSKPNGTVLFCTTRKPGCGQGAFSLTGIDPGAAHRSRCESRLSIHGSIRQPAAPGAAGLHDRDQNSSVKASEVKTPSASRRVAVNSTAMGRVRSPATTQDLYTFVPRVSAQGPGDPL